MHTGPDEIAGTGKHRHAKATFTRRPLSVTRPSWPRHTLACTPIHAAGNNPGGISRIGSNSRGCQATRTKKRGENRQSPARDGEFGRLVDHGNGALGLVRHVLKQVRRAPCISAPRAVNFRSRVNFHPSTSASRVNFRPGGEFGMGSLYQNRSLTFTFA